MTENLLGAETSREFHDISWRIASSQRMEPKLWTEAGWTNRGLQYIATRASERCRPRIGSQYLVKCHGRSSNRTRRHFDQGVCWHPCSFFGKTWPTLKQPGKPFDTARVRLSLPWGWDLGCAIAGNIINNRIPIPLKEYINISRMMKPKKQDPVLNIRGMALQIIILKRYDTWFFSKMDLCHSVSAGPSCSTAC